MQKNIQQNIKLNDLIDIRDITIDLDKTKEERMQCLFEQIKNPYKFKHNDVIINVNFIGDMTLEEKLVDYYRNI